MAAHGHGHSHSHTYTFHFHRASDSEREPISRHSRSAIARATTPRKVYTAGDASPYDPKASPSHGGYSRRRVRHGPGAMAPHVGREGSDARRCGCSAAPGRLGARERRVDDRRRAALRLAQVGVPRA